MSSPIRSAALAVVGALLAVSLAVIGITTITGGAGADLPDATYPGPAPNDSPVDAVGPEPFVDATGELVVNCDGAAVLWARPTAADDLTPEQIAAIDINRDGIINFDGTDNAAHGVVISAVWHHVLNGVGTVSGLDACATSQITTASALNPGSEVSGLVEIEGA